jgi:hypothetical protein
MSKRVFFEVLVFVVNCLIYGGESGKICRIVKWPYLLKKAAVMAYSQNIINLFIFQEEYHV